MSDQVGNRTLVFSKRGSYFCRLRPSGVFVKFDYKADVITILIFSKHGELICVYIILVRFRLLSGHLLGKSDAHSVDYIIVF